MCCRLGLTFLLSVVLRGGLAFEVQLPLRIAVGFALVSVVRHLALVPMVFQWRLGRVAAISMLAFYAVFQCGYLWAIAQEGPS
jgi:Ca2+/Na+ antiporter